MTRRTSADPYETLGVPKDADAATIKRAYKSRARKAHPDRKGGDHDAMAAVNTAYALLSDPVRRARYDDTGESDKPPPREQKARMMVMSIMMEIIDKAMDDIDPVQTIKQSIEKFTREMNEELTKQRRILRTIDKHEKLLKGGEEVFSGVFTARRDKARAAIVALEEDIAMAGDAMTLMKAMTWTGEVPRQGARYYVASAEEVARMFRGSTTT